MAIVTSSGRTTNPEDLAFAVLERERRKGDPKPVNASPSCETHKRTNIDCNGCRRAVVFAVTARDRENREFRRLMGAPERAR